MTRLLGRARQSGDLVGQVEEETGPQEGGLRTVQFRGSWATSTGDHP